MNAPNTMENAAITVCLATPSSSRAIAMARIQIPKRTDQLTIFGDAYPAFTAARSAARDRKFAITSPRNKIKMATTISGSNRNNREICSWSRDIQNTDTDQDESQQSDPENGSAQDLRHRRKCSHSKHARSARFLGKPIKFRKT